MHPWIFVLGGREIRFYGLAYSLTLLIAVSLASRLLTSRGHKGERFWDSLIWFIPAGFLGARLGYVFTNLSDFTGQGWEWIRVDHGGLSFHGGIIAAVITLAVYFRRGSPNFWQVMDSAAMPVAIGIMLVRLGNFMNGDILGYAWDGPWALNYPYDTLHANVYLGPGDYELDPTIIPRHPTELYGFTVGLILLLLMIWFWRMKKWDGFLYYQFIIWYSIIRSIIEEPFRDVPHYLVDFNIEAISAGGVTLTQWSSVAFIAYALIGMYVTPRLVAAARKRGKASDEEAKLERSTRREMRSRKRKRR